MDAGTGTTTRSGSRPEVPPTPTLDAAHTVQPTTELIGAFLAEYLPRQGVHAARWEWVRYPCLRTWTRRNGELVEAGVLVPEADLVDVDPYACPCPSRGDQPGPHMKRELHLVPLTDAWLNEQLARFMGLDPALMEAERAALLAYVRESSRQIWEGPDHATRP